MTVCTVAGCDRAHSARGYCQAHYSRWAWNGDVRPTVPIGEGTTLREVDLTDEEMSVVGEVVEVLAQHALTFVWPALSRGELG